MLALKWVVRHTRISFGQTQKFKPPDLGLKLKKKVNIHMFYYKL